MAGVYFTLLEMDVMVTSRASFAMQVFSEARRKLKPAPEQGQ